MVGDMGQRVKRNCIRSIEMSPLMGRKSILRQTRVQVGSTNVREHYRSSFYNPAIQGYYQSWPKCVRITQMQECIVTCQSPTALWQMMPKTGIQLLFLASAAYARQPFVLGSTTLFRFSLRAAVRDLILLAFQKCHYNNWASHGRRHLQLQVFGIVIGGGEVGLRLSFSHRSHEYLDWGNQYLSTCSQENNNMK